jgi:hypothetical protein
VSRAIFIEARAGDAGRCPREAVEVSLAPIAAEETGARLRAAA